MELNEIRDNAGATHYRKRVGRGIGSGTGKTAAKGHKGQKARRRVRLGFEGGQNPLYRRLPKRGFTNIFKNKYFALNVNLIEQFLNKKILEDNTLINLKLLQDKNIVGKNFDGISLLGNGDINYKIEIEVNKVSKTALEKMDKAGGKVIVVSSSKEDSDNIKTKAKKAEK